jgi:tripartite-type tricarboxylate transporter receptor subunit TctC
MFTDMRMTTAGSFMIVAIITFTITTLWPPSSRQRKYRNSFIIEKQSGPSQMAAFASARAVLGLRHEPHGMPADAPRRVTSRPPPLLATDEECEREGERMARVGVLIAGLLTLVALGAPPPAAAQSGTGNYPNQVVRIVVAISAGSAADVLARAAAEKLTQKWGQQVIVENRPGLAGSASVAKAAPDGYTFMVTANGFIVTGETNPNLSFDPLKDFTGVAQLASLPFILIANPSHKIEKLADLIAAAKARPGELNYASAGFGSTAFLAAALFTQVAGLKMQHVPYRGGPEAVTSVVRGDAHFYFATPFASRELIADGKLRALAVTGPSRVEAAPGVPTFAEAGLPAFRYDAWFGMFAPANVPPPILDKVSRDLVEVFADPELHKRLAAQGLLVATQPRAAFDALIKSDAERFAKLLRAMPK